MQQQQRRRGKAGRSVCNITIRGGRLRGWRRRRRRRGGERRRESAEVPAEGVFVVVVVVVTDKEYGGSEGRRRRQAQNLTPSIALLPFGEGEMAGLASLAAVTLAVGCQEVTSYQ
ncbi:MAG: hypothetical protein J0L63_08055 [Anaerolineae bacterium]|nr:hypothetical protein [Anaerolineae bacterium]